MLPPYLNPTAMVFAAGYGKRLAPMTYQTPKPLIDLGGTNCLDLTLQKLQDWGIQKIIVNTHHLSDQIETHLASNKQVKISYEPVILETGGAIRQVLNELGDDPFLAVSGDIFWDDPYCFLFDQIAKTWDSRKMDGLLVIVPLNKSFGYQGKGDFLKNPDSFLWHKNLPPSSCQDWDPSLYVFGGIQILKPSLFEQFPLSSPFPLLKIYQMISKNNRLKGVVWDGFWVDIGTLPGLEIACNYLADTHPSHSRQLSN